MERNTRARKEPQKYMRKNSANKWGMERYVKNKENKKKYKIDTWKMGSWSEMKKSNKHKLNQKSKAKQTEKWRIHQKLHKEIGTKKEERRR